MSKNQSAETAPPIWPIHVMMKALARQFQIIYMFPHATQDFNTSSPFGWYTPGILATASPMQQACTLPADIREAHSDIDDVIVHRLTGVIWPHLLPVEIDSLEVALTMLASHFIVCVTTDKEVAVRVDEILNRYKVPVMHVSSIPAPDRHPPPSFNTANICAHVRKVLDVLSQRPEQERLVRDCRQILAQAPQRMPRKHHLRQGMHNVTVPNEIALAAFGYKLLSTKRISKPIGASSEYSTDNYVNRICESADAVAAERKRLLTGRIPFLEDHRAIIAVASSYGRFYSSWKGLIQKAPSDQRQEIRRSLHFALRSPSYFHQMPWVESSTSDARTPLALAHELLGHDMRAFTSALCALSSATLCPVLRLEPKLNQIRADAAELARCVRAQAGSKYHWKQSRMTRVLGQKMRDLIHPEFLKRIDEKESSRIEGLKLVTDLPLELLPSKGIPLSLRFDTSRVSPVPGNMFWQTCNLPPIHLQADAFYDIMIVRSFSSTDSIRGVLEKALKAISIPGQFKRVKFRFVDVNTPEQFAEAINAFNGAVMIFDGHGRYDSDQGIGQLIIGGKSLDTWALKRVCRLPPIVMFSACDTQPIEGNHGSVATAAFALGARAVLGTMFPVNAVHSSIMMARMLLRIDQFLPIAVSLFPALTWRHIVSGMLRMSHVVEAAQALNGRGQLGLTEESLARIQMKTNMEINSWLPTWFDFWVDALSQESSQSVAEIRRLLERHVGITDAMKYVQLGNPERIFIYERRLKSDVGSSMS